MKVYSLENKYNLIKKCFNAVGDNQSDGKTYFFVVGIDNYINEEKLNYSKGDAKKFIDLFNNSETSTKNVYTLFDKEASKINITKSLKQFQRLLKPEDRLIMYLSGHGMSNDLSNFFIPYDGHKENYISCIADTFIQDCISDFVAQYVVLIIDLAIENKTFWKEAKQDRLYAEKLKDLNAKDLITNSFKNYLEFHCEAPESRIRQSYCFVKDSLLNDTNRHHFLEIKSHESKLRQAIDNQYHYLLSLTESSKQQFYLLNQLIRILKNNDPHLLNKIETLRYKYLQLAGTIVENPIAKNEIEEDTQTITDISIETIERIYQNGFYLIRTQQPKHIYELPEKPKTKILFTSANPRNENFLRLDSEAKEIEYQLLKSRRGDEFEFIKLKSLHVEEFEDALLTHNPQFIHFSGHGSCNGIALLDEKDNTHVVKNKSIADLLKLFSKDVQCVFLNSCHSSAQSLEICKYINKVICMSSKVPDQLAIHFAAAFYKSIGAGRDIDFSFQFAKTSLDLKNVNGSDIPQLLPN